jgi:hypothetical protein
MPNLFLFVQGAVFLRYHRFKAKERCLNRRTVSAKTKARLLHEVDARNGWELQQKTVEVQRVKKQTKTKVKQMVG